MLWGYQNIHESVRKSQHTNPTMKRPLSYILTMTHHPCDPTTLPYNAIYASRFLSKCTDCDPSRLVAKPPSPIRLRT
jgi:hypothetical protein